jgi:hypothetical protein
LPRQIFLGKTILGKKYQQKKIKRSFSLLARLLIANINQTEVLAFCYIKAFHLIQNDLVDERL